MRPVACDVEVPAGWTVRRPGGAVAVTASPAAWSGAVPPCFSVVETRRARLRSLDEYVTEQVAGVARWTAARVVRIDVAEVPVPVVDLAVAFVVAGTAVAAVQRHLLGAGGRAVVATAVGPAEAWRTSGPVLLRCVRSLRGQAGSNQSSFSPAPV